MERPPPATKVCRGSLPNPQVAALVNVKVPFVYLQVLISARRVRYLQVKAAVLSFIGMRKVSESPRELLQAPRHADNRTEANSSPWRVSSSFFPLSFRAETSRLWFLHSRSIHAGWIFLWGGRCLQGPLMIADFIANKYF